MRTAAETGGVCHCPLQKSIDRWKEHYVRPKGVRAVLSLTPLKADQPRLLPEQNPTLKRNEWKFSKRQLVGVKKREGLYKSE